MLLRNHPVQYRLLEQAIEIYVRSKPFNSEERDLLRYQMVNSVSCSVELTGKGGVVISMRLNDGTTVSHF